MAIFTNGGISDKNSAYIANYHKALDRKYIAEAKTAFLETTAYGDGATLKEVRIPFFEAAGYGNYDPATGYPEGNIVAGHRSYTLPYDRGFSITIDRIDEKDILPQFNIIDMIFKNSMERKIIPEYDAVRISDLVKAAKADGKVVKANLTDTNTLFALDEAIKYFRNLGIEHSNMYLFISPEVEMLLKRDSAGNSITRFLSLDTKVGDITRRISSYEGIPTIVMPDARFFEEVNLLATPGARDADSIKPSFKPITGAKALNFLFVPRTQNIGAITRHAGLKVFSPEQVFTKDAWIVQARAYYGTIIPKNAAKAIYAHIKA